MINSTNYENIIISIREKIINILKICPNSVYNSLSVHGSDLLKTLNEKEFTSYNLNDCFILFRLEEDSDKYYVLNEEDETKSSIYSFTFHIHIYGNPSHNASQKLLVGFKNETILQNLYDRGIHILGLTPVKFTYEPINNVIWPRCDLEIKLEVRFNFEDNIDEGYFELKKDIVIETIEQAKTRQENEN